ncbi:MAG TPA: potassium transporter Kup [Vicinamibacterales bacterium]
MSQLPRGRRQSAALAFLALGVVYGDIGTSPLYAIRECFNGPHAVAVTHDHVLGVLSLIFWALVIVVSVKYLVFVLRADNHGEGGILALTAFATPIKPTGRSERAWLIYLGIFGAALLYGDGIITPSISVLGAVEGLSVATPALQPYVVPITIGILIALFWFQHRGTAGVGKVFAPVMLVWFAVLATLGVLQIMKYPSVLEAVNPIWAVRFFADTGWAGYFVMGSVFLVVTGGEALYADMGHFGVKPIRLDWFTVVLPSLLLNYFGQGALLLENPATSTNPFYLLAPDWAIYPMIVLAVAAAAIAAQAVISGAFSLTMQAVQLGFSPRIKIDHTSTHSYGQIYIGGINWMLMIGCILTVLSFRSSSNLAAAYGVAVTTTMLITSVLFFVVARERWGWNMIVASSLTAVFLVIDGAFFGANIIKVGQGGWLPLMIAGVIFTIMITWKRGRRILAERIQAEARPLEDFLKEVQGVTRVPGTAIFMSGTASKTPPALRHNLEHNKVLHQQVIFITVKTEQVPHVPEEQRLAVEHFGDGMYRVKVHYGFMEDPNIPAILSAAEGTLLPRIDPQDTTYFLGRETIISTQRHGMVEWREKLFALMARNATTATAFFGIPPDRVVELGEQIEI